jgi:cytochrome b
MRRKSAIDIELEVAEVYVWDLPIRLAHWTLVVLLCFSWWTATESQMQWHRFSGYAILTVVLFRVYWGFVGPSTARFVQFVRGPAAVIGYSRSLLKRSSARAMGHNPLGGWNVMILLFALLLQTLLGLFAVDVDGIESGPLSYLVSFETGRAAARLHGRVFNLLEIFIMLHLAAISFYHFYKRQNLIAAMIVGTRRLSLSAFRARGRLTYSWRAAAIGLFLSALLVTALARGLR